MVARPTIPIRSCNAGEFSQEMRGRVDIKQYYSAGLAFKNIEPVPQSGFRRMGGSRRIGQWRKPFSAVAITGAALIPGPHTGTKTIWAGTVAGDIAAVLASGLAISAGHATFDVEAQVSGVWTRIAGPFNVSSVSPATRLAALAPGTFVTATGLRIVATFSVSATVSGLTVTASREDGEPLRPRFTELTTDEGDVISCFLTAGVADFYTHAGYVGAAHVPDVTSTMLPDIGFYAEGNTIGIFHGDLRSQRLFLMGASALNDWRTDLWPYDPVPKADLGGDYPKTDDVWDITVRYSSGWEIALQITVNGETPGAITTPAAASGMSPAQWASYCGSLQTALEGLPGLGPGVAVTWHDMGSTAASRIRVAFGGTLAGEEYEMSAMIANTAEASALAYHTQIGKTEKEDLFSVDRGWPRTTSLLQDRMAYARIPAARGALSLSRVGEYFDLNVDAKADNAARLDKLRSQTSETILHVKESNYFFVFTDRATYFIPNRTIERNTPLNFVICSEMGAQPTCEPFELEGQLYYVAINPEGLNMADEGGRQLFRVEESVTSAATSFEADPVSLLASHLVDKVIRSVRQKPEQDLDAARGWLMRTDGRVIVTQMIKSQEINGYCEWIAAGSGAVREVGVDGRNKLWMAIERSGRTSIELYDTTIFLQDTVDASTDLAGKIIDLPYEDGAELWAVADGYVLGPFTVQGGVIDIEDAYSNVLVGRWTAPHFETMPQVYVTPADEVLHRPGRIHTLIVNIADTSSIAVGANGQPPVDIVLHETTDPVDQPMPAKTKQIVVAGSDLPGFMTGTTAVITQTRPGELRVRDIGIGAKL
ncbi:hypothetical protein [Aquamicrobium defluvii]|uniref:Uncharacterized protein n=1 Tax=Aquamicrobium defluvii TaxID=69279 RepID=A0A4R6YGM1_9HYPH|nr:hypothetical protein [Aquamicrobium defluvii]TDR35694.1 hypothetical protein DES43_108119 [Aquamicrobium defluvii]